MGIILEKLKVIGRKGERTVSALFDTGSTHCLVREDIAREIGDVVELPELKRFELASGASSPATPFSQTSSSTESGLVSH